MAKGTTKKSLYSPISESCGHSWYFKPGTLNNASANLGLNLAGRCRQLSLVLYDNVHFYLKALMPVPQSPVHFQLWVANQDNPEKDLHAGKHTPGWSMPAAVSII